MQLADHGRDTHSDEHPAAARARCPACGQARTPQLLVWMPEQLHEARPGSNEGAGGKRSQRSPGTASNHSFCTDAATWLDYSMRNSTGARTSWAQGISSAVSPQLVVSSADTWARSWVTCLPGRAAQAGRRTAKRCVVAAAASGEQVVTECYLSGGACTRKHTHARPSTSTLSLLFLWGWLHTPQQAAACTTNQTKHGNRDSD
jgi:hypothetical protein